MSLFASPRYNLYLQQLDVVCQIKLPSLLCHTIRRCQQLGVTGPSSWWPRSTRKPLTAGSVFTCTVIHFMGLIVSVCLCVCVTCDQVAESGCHPPRPL